MVNIEGSINCGSENDMDVLRYEIEPLVPGTFDSLDIFTHKTVQMGSGGPAAPPRERRSSNIAKMSVRSCRHGSRTTSPRKYFVVVLLMLLCCAVAVDLPVIALYLPQTTHATPTTVTTNESTGVAGYTALSKALGSAIRLAVEDVNAAGALLKSGYNLTVTVVEQNTTTGMVQTVCDLMTTSGNIYGVSGGVLSAHILQAAYSVD